MTNSLRHRAVRLATLGIAPAVFGMLLVAGCFNPFAPRVAPTTGFSQQAPKPTSAIGVLRLYEWCWNKRDPDLYRELFTDDYQFLFAQTDTAGNAYRDRALNREVELDIATNIFVRGSATEPPPARITLIFQQNLIDRPDSRRNKNARVHREIAAQTNLRIEAPDIQVTGTTRFFVVRGDSALLPRELVDRGFRQDSTRWYIERIDDETLSDDLGGTRAWRAPAPATAARREPRARSQYFDPQSLTWGQVKAFWDDRVPLSASRARHVPPHGR